MQAEDNMSLKTANSKTGIVAIAAASRLNMQSKTSTLLKTGTTFTLTVGTAWDSTTGTTWDHTSTRAIEIESLRDITIDAGPNIFLNPEGGE